MGECMQRQRAKRFKHLSSEAREKLLDAQNLFSDFPEIQRRIFKCVFANGRVPLKVGETLLLVDQGDELIRVILDQALVGYVKSDDSQFLRATVFADDRASSIAVAMVHSVAQLTDTFDVVLNEANFG